MSHLYTLKFKCIFKNCDQEFSYEKSLDHLVNCPENFSKCILNCDKLIKNKFMEIHCLKDCENNEFRCDSCDLTIKIKKLHAHDCKEDLK